MSHELIMIGSITMAMRAKDVLKSEGISCYVEKNTSPDRTGCGYGVVLVNGDRAEAELLLRRYGIRYSGGDTGQR